MYELIIQNNKIYTVFNLITAPALITAPLTFTFVLTYYCPFDDLFPDFIFTFYCPFDDLLALVVENKLT